MGFILDDTNNDTTLENTTQLKDFLLLINANLEDIIKSSDVQAIKQKGTILVRLIENAMNNYHFVVPTSGVTGTPGEPLESQSVRFSTTNSPTLDFWLSDKAGSNALNQKTVEMCFVSLSIVLKKKYYEQVQQKMNINNWSTLVIDEEMAAISNIETSKNNQISVKSTIDNDDEMELELETLNPTPQQPHPNTVGVEDIVIIRRSDRVRRPYAEWSRCMLCDPL